MTDTDTHRSFDGVKDGVPRFVVGIGASAGGLDPLVRFFDHLPGDTGMAFVIVQHLSPDFKSLMDELLARHTPLPIHLVEDGMPVEPDHVYLIPPKKEMIISGGRLLLSERDRQQELTLPIDVFFRSLAQDCGSRAVAIVLSGGGSDGSRGIRAVHEAGGLVLLQDADTAQFDGMPRAAREVGVADYVLAPQEMPQALLTQAGSGKVPRPVESGPEPEGFDAVYQMLQQQFGIDFTHYKPSTVTRRIERRLALARSQNIEEYLRRLRSEREELDSLYRDLLIGVTRFFRDPEAFALLERDVLPRLIERAPRETPLRLWVAGCATGEEAYSLAIVLQDLMARLGERAVKIFATDVHRGSLERAALGIYEEEAVSQVSPERLGRYFARTGQMYQVVPEVRQLLVFAQHNVIRDAPFTRLDLITCRNLLIYLQPAAQQKVLSLFHFGLNQGGTLFLGPSESLGAVAHGFEVVDKHWQIYVKHGEARTPVEARRRPALPEVRPTTVPTSVALPRHSLAQLLGAYDALLSELMPPSLLITDRGELLHAFGGAGRFLRIGDGRPGLEIQHLFDGELRLLLGGALRRAVDDPAVVVFKGVRAGGEDDESLYNVSVRGVRPQGGGSPHVLISFEPTQAVPRPRPRETEIDLDRVSHDQLAALEAELGYTKENLQAAIEQLEASNEEMQTSNEELQSSNEELQSTNEELQSVNEELYTVNSEYQRKIAELTELTNDMDNLLASTEVGTIFLDSQLRIRKFTPQVAETFNLLPHDVGRPIDSFAHKMDHPELVEDLRRVLRTGKPVERDIVDHTGKAFFLRLLPYRARGAADGVVLTLIDVSGLKEAEDALFHERYLLNSLMSTVPDAIYFKDSRGRLIRANAAFAARVGLRDAAEAVGKTALDLPAQDIALELQREDEVVLRSGEAQLYRLESRIGGDGWDLVSRLPLRDRDGRLVGVIVILRDVTEQQRAEAKIQEAVRRRDQFLAMLSHELRNPLGAIVTATAMLKSEAAGAMEPAAVVGVLERQSHQMARLLDDLLEASRVTQNKIDLRKRVVDLRAVAREAVDAVRGHLEAQGIRFTVDLDPAPLFVDGDPARLQQIQVNLMSNAIKYTPRGGQVALQVRREAGSAVVRVRDDGVGIPSGMLDSIFDLFVQSSRTLDRSAGGLGVGLTLVRSLVGLHGGSVSAHSDGEGRGSEFVVRLPLASNVPTEAGAARHLPAFSEGTRILVVEDNEDSRMMLCALLTSAGFGCHSAENGPAALALLDEVRPEIAILDVGLPVMDGFELARRIRANSDYAGICLIALTGYGQAADRAESTAAGFQAHLVKPVQADQLLTLITEMRRDWKPGNGHATGNGGAENVDPPPPADAAGPSELPS